MKKFLYLLPILLILGCPTIFPPKRDTRPYRTPETRRPAEPKDVTPTTQENIFNSSFSNVWSATLEGLEWMKWVTAFTDELEGTIRLKEAYVYRKSGKLLRMYNWPGKSEVMQSRIGDYLEKVSDYNAGFNLGTPIFTQENMGIRIVALSESGVKVDIQYDIRPYFSSVGFTDAIKSSGYIESLLLEKIKENLTGKPLAKQ